MTETTPRHDINNGDRVRIQQGQRSIPDLIGHIGTITEVFRLPLGSCMVRIDNDPDGQREWFLYRDELVIGAV
jgi:hypothetical protein